MVAHPLIVDVRTIFPDCYANSLDMGTRMRNYRPSKLGNYRLLHIVHFLRALHHRKNILQQALSHASIIQ